MPIFHKLVWFFRVFIKYLQPTLDKIPQWSCKTTPFLPCQKQLCSQRPILVHVSSNDSELLLTPHLSFTSNYKWDIVVATAAPVQRKWQTVKLATWWGWNMLIWLWAWPEQYDVILLRKSKWFDNWDGLGFFGDKKRREWIFIIVGGSCPHNVFASNVPFKRNEHFYSARTH